MTRTVQGEHVVTRLLFSLITAFWLWVFLPVLSGLGMLSDAGSFVWVFLLFALVQTFTRHIFIVFLDVLISFLYLFVYYHPTDVPIMSGVPYVLKLDYDSLRQLIYGHTPGDPFQTQLFILICAVLYQFISYASRRTRIWAIYNVLGIALLAAVDGNTDVHLTFPVVGIIFAAFFVLGLLQWKQIYPHVSRQKRNWYRFFLPMTVSIVIFGLIGLLLPKREAAWANPFQDGFSFASGAPTHMVGYQLDQSELGGSFVEDDTPVVSVIESRPSYLRGQTLSVYTGHGWTSAKLTAPDMDTFTTKDTIDPTADSLFVGLPVRSLKQVITILNINVPTHDLLGEYRLSAINQLPKGAKSTFLFDEVQGNVWGPDLKMGQSYTVTSDQMEDPYSTLQTYSLPLGELASAIPGDIQADDLQLPPTLPNRDRTLAENLAKGEQNEYDVVTSVVSYLQENYTYQTNNVPVPGPHQDYVDQFLFQSKVGYCNNFSSAMAVLLRTLGIPTRWVTGFASGVLDTSYEGSGQKYIERERDAHSWVEVYFPNYGWIPFDPTPNYYLNFAPTPTPSSGTTSPATAPPKTHVKPPTAPNVTPKSVTGASNSVNYMPVLRGMVISILGLIILLGLVLWIFRRRVYTWTLTKNLKRKSDRQSVAFAIRYLLRMVRERGQSPRPTPTVRELLPVAVKSGIGTDEFREFAKNVEEVLYSPRKARPEAYQRIRSVWKGFVDALSGRRRRTDKD